MMLPLYIHNHIKIQKNIYGTNDLGLSFYNYDLRQCSRQAIDVGFMEKKVALIQVSLRILRFSLASNILL